MLADLGGANDRFTAISENPTFAEPGSALQAGCCWPSFHGANVNGYLIAHGEDPQIVSVPSQAVSLGHPGRRGFGIWSSLVVPRTGPLNGSHPDSQLVDADWHGLSGGAAPHATGAAPTIALSAPPTAQADSTVPVTGALHSSDGTPVEGARVRFDLQLELTIPGSTLFKSTWHVDGITDAEGVARAHLPTEMTGRNMFGGPYPLDPAGPWRILASYDGSDDLYPAKAAQALTITPAG